MRGLPLLVMIFLIFYVPPAFNIEVSGFAAVTVALSIFAGAHISEIVRGAISVGVTRPERCRESARSHILAPHLVRHPAPGSAGYHPPWTNTASRWSRGSLAYLVSVSELLFQTYKVVGRTGAAMPCTSPLRSSTLSSTLHYRVLVSGSSVGFVTPHELSDGGSCHD